eukprot:804562-Amphidinium_carterae.1
MSPSSAMYYGPSFKCASSVARRQLLLQAQCHWLDRADCSIFTVGSCSKWHAHVWSWLARGPDHRATELLISQFYANGWQLLNRDDASSRGMKSIRRLFQVMRTI